MKKTILLQTNTKRITNKSQKRKGMVKMKTLKKMLVIGMVLVIALQGLTIAQQNKEIDGLTRNVISLNKDKWELWDALNQ